MWIRSQNKCVLIKCKNIVAYQNIKMNKFVIITNDGTDIELGYYSTKEKVLQVLDLIEEYQKYQYLKTSNYTGKPFQMPQDKGDR
jgi:gamma-glutamylcyclotransferase (GGCT)/AIG2-like uncharacterized protein YtfP